MLQIFRALRVSRRLQSLLNLIFWTLHGNEATHGQLLTSVGGLSITNSEEKRGSTAALSVPLGSQQNCLWKARVDDLYMMSKGRHHLYLVDIVNPSSLEWGLDGSSPSSPHMLHK
jgi:hypothetical protein